MSKAANNTGSSSKDGLDVPPELCVSLPLKSQISKKTKHPNEVSWPIDFLLLTVKDCEFLACYMQLKNPLRCWFDGVGYIYFEDQFPDEDDKVKVALMRCCEGSTIPGGSLITVKNAVTKLRPKGVISVGTCSGLNPEKTKLGDVVVSAKLTTYASKIVTSTGEQSTGMRSYVSRHFLHLLKHAGDGWEAPLKNPEARDIKVHCDGEFLSGPEQVSAGWRREELAKSYPLATAIEMEGEGIFIAAFDDQIEWLMVKGITDFADGTECVSENWSPFASVMAASVVANILSDPVVFQGWRHYTDVSEENQSSSSRSKRGSPNPKRIQLKGCASAPFDLERCQAQLRRHYNTTSQVQITPWNPNDTVHINEVYTNLSWLREDKTPRGTTEQKLEDYSKVFEGDEQSEHPQRILIYGRPGIGKTTFSQKLSFDWSNGKKEILKKFDLLLTISLRNVCNIQDFGDVLKAANLLAADDAISVDSLHKYVRENQERVLIVLDGYDEYNAGEQSDIHKIWKGSLLRDCCVLMTTRPSEDDEIRKSSDIQCKIRGFDSEEQVEKFARKFLGKREDVENLKKYLSKEQIWDIAEIPLLLLMMCLIWREKHYKRLPKSRLELYERFVETILYHMVVKESGKCVKGHVLDFYKDELIKIGKVALEALLRGDAYVPRRHLDTQSNSLSETMIRAGLFQISKLSSSAPDDSLFFLHKSIQEFLAAWFIMHETDFKKGRTDCVSSIDSLAKILKVQEILKFMCEWSVDGASAVSQLLRLIGEKDGLTAFSFTKTPSTEDLSWDQRSFISISLDCLLCCSTSDRPAVFPLFLDCINYVLILNEEQVSIAAREHLLRSTSSLPNYVFFDCGVNSLYKNRKQPIEDDIFSILLDLNTAVVWCSGEIRTVEKYNNLLARYIFLRKEGQQMFFHLTYIGNTHTGARPSELLTELASTPVSPPQKPVDELSKNQDNSRDLVLTENVPDPTRQHCLSFVRKIRIYQEPSEELMVVNNVLPFVTSPRKVVIGSRTVTYDAELIESIVSNIHFTDNLHSLTLAGISLTAKCATDIARSLHQAPNLHELNLSGKPLWSGVSDLADNLPQLTKLELRNVHMGDKQTEVLATSLKHVKKLQVLGLSNNPLGHGIIKLAKHLNCVPELNELRLNDTQMSDEEASAVAHCLKSLPQLKKLFLSNNPLGHGIIELAKHLSSVPHLTELWLYDTQMGEEEVSALARSLKYVPELEWLDLQSNPLGRGVSDLIQHLSSIPKLRNLFLRSVKITRKEAEELCTAVRGTDIDLSTDYHIEDIESGVYRLIRKEDLVGNPWLKLKWPMKFADEDEDEDKSITFTGDVENDEETTPITSADEDEDDSTTSDNEDDDELITSADED